MSHHTHDWQPSQETTRLPDGTDQPLWACTECETTSPACVLCERATGTSLAICDPCADRQGAMLRDIDHALDQYQPEPRSLIPPTRWDRDKITGGQSDALPFGIQDIAHPGIQTPADITEVLESWAQMWSEAGAGELEAPAGPWLGSRIMWAAHHPGASDITEWAEEMRQLRHHARRIAGLLPYREPAPCVHCGGQLVRDWVTPSWQPRPDGLSDVVRCTGCLTEWENPERLLFAARTHLQALPEVRPEHTVTAEDARYIFPTVPVETIRTWVKREREAADRAELARQEWAEQQAQGIEGPEPAPYRGPLPQQGWDERGRPVYQVADLAALAARRADQTRRGRKAKTVAAAC